MLNLKSINLQDIDMRRINLSNVLLGSDTNNPLRSSLVDLFDFRGRSNLDADRKQVVGKKGNVLTLNNFSFSKMSGYGGFNVDFNTFNKHGVSGTLATSVIKVTKIAVLPNGNKSSVDRHTYSLLPGMSHNVPSYKIKVTGLQNGLVLQKNDIIQDVKGEVKITIDKDGIYDIPAISYTNPDSVNRTFSEYYNFINDIGSELTVNITIEQIPLYPDSLVFDGVDDWAQVIDGDVWGKTVIMRCTPLKLGTVLYDQRDNSFLGLAMYNGENEKLAYNARNPSKKTYIDGELNTTRYPTDLLNVDQIIAIPADTETNHSNFTLGCTFNKVYFAHMAVKYLAIYKDVLTPEQIREEIDKLEGDLIEPYARYDLKEQGATNESMKLNPILRNLQGNPDYDIKLRNFLWALNSGVGKYDTDFKVGWDLAGSYGEIASPTKVEANVSSSVPSGSYIVRCKSLDSIRSDSFKIRVKGISDTNYSLNIGFSDSLLSVCNTDGIHTINKNEIPVSTQSGDFGFKLRPFTIMKEFKIEIELIPENPNGLYFDGVDDFGLCERFPILTDYTVMDKREFQSENIIGSCFLSKRARDSAGDSGAFQIERIGGGNDPLTFSFGIINPIKLPINTKDVICQTRNSYNGNNIKYGSAQDTNTLTVGKFNPTSSHYTKVVFYNAVFWDRTLTDYELKRAKRKYFKTE